MTGKIRVSIVATALDGHKAENNTVLNMVSRIQNRNTGYSDNLFSHNPRVENNPISSIDGATALKLDESFQIDEEETGSYNIEKNIIESGNFVKDSNEMNENLNNIPSGVSIESASYIENNNLKNNEKSSSTLSNENEEEYTPKLFSDDQSYQSEENLEANDPRDNDTDQLFDQDLNEEEILRYLRF